MRHFGKVGKARAFEKNQLRTEILAKRAKFPMPVADSLRISEAALKITRNWLGAKKGVVAAYLAVAPEPDPMPLVQELSKLGYSVILPVLQSLQVPQWGKWGGDLVSGFRGIMMPALADGDLAQADVIWITGLAASPTGDRLGTGGGWYDRALAMKSPKALVGVLLYDDEVLAQIPVESWDQRVAVIVTPKRVIWCDTPDDENHFSS